MNHTVNKIGLQGTKTKKPTQGGRGEGEEISL